jgi:hypothetical protein
MEIPLADVPGQEPTPAAPFPVRQCLDGIADSDSAGDRQFSFLEFRGGFGVTVRLTFTRRLRFGGFLA